MPRRLRGPCRPGCPNLAGQCETHKPRTISSTARGYGYDHQQERKAWTPVVKAGRATCRRCQQPLPADIPANRWDVGHPDAHCPAPKGPEHVGCNRATAGRPERRRGGG